MKSYKFFDVYVTSKGNLISFAPTRTESMMIMFAAIGIKAQLVTITPRN
mgnify:CR=1 FL=1